MSASGGGLASIREELGDASNVLFLAPSMDPREDEGCARLVSGEPADPANVLCVTLADSPDDRAAVWRTHAGEAPDKLGFVDVGDPTRSTAATDPVDDPAGKTTIEPVSSPADLTGLGIEISRFLSDWHGDGNRLAVCFHSLTTLLQYVDLKDVFRFVHVITGRLEAADAVAHYHLDPTAHDERTINTLKSLFDAVIELEDDGDWTVTRR